MTMIERVAKEIYEAHWISSANAGFLWEKMSPAYKLPWITAARAAIAALREPTRKMIDSVEEFSCGDFNGVSRSTVRAVWENMIDAALKEP